MGVTISWEVPLDAVPGTYRIVHTGYYKHILKGVTRYEGASSPFTVGGVKKIAVIPEQRIEHRIMSARNLGSRATLELNHKQDINAFLDFIMMNYMITNSFLDFIRGSSIPSWTSSCDQHSFLNCDHQFLPLGLSIDNHTLP